MNFGEKRAANRGMRLRREYSIRSEPHDQCEMFLENVRGKLPTICFTDLFKNAKLQGSASMGPPFRNWIALHGALLERLVQAQSMLCSYCENLWIS